MSASDPAVSSNAARVRAYASTTHCRSENDALSDVWMSGRATFTMVMSSRSMKVPSETATNVIHLLGSPASGSVAVGRAVSVTRPHYEQATSRRVTGRRCALAQVPDLHVQAPRVVSPQNAKGALPAALRTLVS